MRRLVAPSTVNSRSIHVSRLEYAVRFQRVACVPGSKCRGAGASEGRVLQMA